MTKPSRQRSHARRMIAAAVVLLIGGANCGGILDIEDAECRLEGCSGDSAVCLEYCDTVQAACSGEFSVYVSRPICLAVCRHLEPGRPGDDGVNTVQCRLRQAQFAADQFDFLTHCPPAGPGGGDFCGSNCEGLCTILQSACVNNQQFLSFDACMENCLTTPDMGDYNTADPEMSEGDSVQCRLWHVSASAEAIKPHCPHAAGASPCTGD
jgi:hypothetical protein